MFRYLIYFITIPLLANIKIGYKDAVQMAFRYGRKSFLLIESQKTSEYALNSARYGFGPKWSIKGSQSSKDDASAGLHWQQSFGTGATASADYNVLNKQTSLSFSQPLLKGFQQNALSLAGSEDSFEQQKLAQKKTAQNITQEVLASYWRVISAQKNKNVQLLGKKSSQKLYQQYKIKVDMGLLPRYSLVEQEGQMQRFRLQELQQRTEELKSTQTLRLLLNVPSGNELTLTADINLDSFGTLPSLTQVIKSINSSNIDIKSAKIALEVAKRNYKIAYNSVMPSVDLNGNMQTDDANISLAVSVPINDNSLKQQLLTAKSALTTAQLNLDQTIQDKQINAKNILLDLQAKSKEHELLSSNVRISAHLYELTRQQYKHGLASSLDVITRQKTLVSDQLALITNDIAYLTSYISLMAEQGALLDYFEVKV